MKQLRLFVVAAMAAISMSAMAQVTYGNDYQYKPTNSTIYGSDNEAFGLFYAQYNATTQHMTVTNHDSENESLNGITLGYSHFIPLGDIPLFVSPGGAVQYFFKSKDGVKTNMISLKIPINLMYSFQVSDAFRIEPYAGIYGRINIWGQMKEDGGESLNFFDSDKMGDAAAKRFQLGWNAGVNFRITEAFTIGAGYFMDILKLQDYTVGKHDIKTNFQGFDITLGVNF
jgi:opacity protein-like surface antigen